MDNLTELKFIENKNSINEIKIERQFFNLLLICKFVNFQFTFLIEIF